MLLYSQVIIQSSGIKVSRIKACPTQRKQLLHLSQRLLAWRHTVPVLPNLLTCQRAPQTWYFYGKISDVKNPMYIFIFSTHTLWVPSLGQALFWDLENPGRWSQRSKGEGDPTGPVAMVRVCYFPGWHRKPKYVWAEEWLCVCYVESILLQKKRRNQETSEEATTVAQAKNDGYLDKMGRGWK